MFRLVAHVQPFAWGSVTSMPDLLGFPNTGKPQAELWMGAHPSLPSAIVIDGIEHSLDGLVAEDPKRWLGARDSDRFAGSFPFLLKILAAGGPLSIQVHPSLSQASSGYSKENAAGLAANASDRNYKDGNHKPELIYALTDFEALCGFRPVAEAVAILRSMGGDLLDNAASTLESHSKAADGDSGYSSVVSSFLNASGVERDELFRQVVEGARAVLASETASDIPVTAAARASLVSALELAEQYEGDPGVAVSLLLNRVSMKPGEALFLGAGNMHAYLFGTGVELMANSDNVLRGGLTPKHVDVAELTAILDDRPLDVPFVEPVGSNGFVAWPVPVNDFCLHRTASSQTSTRLWKTDRCAIGICTSGSFVLTAPDRADLVLERGQSVFLLPDVEVQVNGTGELFLATSGD